ncbi:PstS family phosphate ABC transporter substrate-binding protein [Natronococcus sp. A-GB7]|uniref:PstS family phosphate ABC transporter substrate-binding protein n=1 Tax=Natronococcus sp. A-GB7 TaxID=3037649 RepID=UPI00241ECBCE|nr:PstS family phosphate ABC transporter substrate-binding protein [Natronococcus sp. A-GB7]MDG5818236.1 PstS family phosphate ABC transporter substrate-binding protein [Natronococcus sp. A-GB7]
MAPSQNPNGGLTRRTAITTIGGIGLAGLAGCMGSDGDGLSGDVAASGSNTVAPITQVAAEDFEAEYSGVAVAVEPEGTGAGFQEFCQANSDFQSASREITDEEIDLCGENDVDYTHYTVGQDTLAVGVNEDNDWCEEITLDELEEIWQFESDVEQWSDVRDDWPDEDIALHGRDSASGTFDYFTEHINGEMGNIRDDYSATSQTDEIWDAVADNEYALGWGGVGHLRSLQEQDGTLRAVEVESDTDGEFYPPEEEYIEGGEYSPLARPLFFYFNHASLEEDPDLIGSFARFYINNQHGFAEEVGFYRATDDDVVENHDQLDSVLEEIGEDPDELTVERQDP